MPLDSTTYADGLAAGAAAGMGQRARMVLDPDLEIGQALKVARQSLGLSLSDIAEATRVRERHLAAIEAGQIDQLPARPFTIGYVRAYAKALGLDVDATASRFRTEHPSLDDALHNPVGVKHAPKPKRSPLLIALAVGAGIAVVGWNVSRHIEISKVEAAIAQRSAARTPQHVNSAPTGPFTLDTPLPAPPEATAPKPYETPIVGPNAPLGNVAPQSSNATAAPAAGANFSAQGTIYGSAQGASSLIIQARKSITLEVKGPGGAVYFARELSAGEAYRVPALPSLTAWVSNPANAELFDGGVSKGPFTEQDMPLRTGG